MALGSTGVYWIALFELLESHGFTGEEVIAKSLQGNWRAEHLFALKQARGTFDFIGTQLAECD